MDLKSWSCIFLGYGDDEFGYQIWNLADRKLIQSRNIVFLRRILLPTGRRRRRVHPPS